jgi:hypothetical protein
VHQLAREHLEPRRDQPKFRRCRSVPNLDLHVGPLQVSEYALVDTLGNSRSTVTSSTDDPTTMGMEPMGDSKFMWGIEGRKI